MQVSLRSGKPAIQPIPYYENEHTSFGLGYCGEQSYEVALANGDPQNFMLVQDFTNLYLQSSDLALAGSYQMILTVRMTNYPAIKLEQTFIVYLFDLFAGDNHEDQYDILYDDPLTFTPSCFLYPETIFDLKYVLGFDEANLP